MYLTYFKKSSLMEQSNKNNKRKTKQKKNISINFSPFKIDQLKNVFKTIPTKQQQYNKNIYNKLTNFAGDDLLDIV